MLKNSFWLGLVITLLFTGIVVLGYWYFFAPKDKVVIDNPTAQELNIKINQQSYILAKEQSLVLDLPTAKYRLQYVFKNEMVDTMVEIRSPRTLINPTKSDYYVFTRPYGVGNNRDSIFVSNFLEIDQKVYFGQIKHHNSLVIDQFTLNLNQDYPKLIKRNDKSNQKTRIRKVFRKEDFKQFYFNHYQ